MGDKRFVSHSIQTFPAQLCTPHPHPSKNQHIMDRTTNNYPPPYSVTPGAPPPAGFVAEPQPTGYPQQQPPPPSFLHGNPQGYPAQGQFAYQQQPGTTVVQVTPVPPSAVVIIGGCPSCRVTHKRPQQGLGLDCL